MSKSEPELLSAVVGDICSVFLPSGGGTASVLLRRLFGRRLKQAQEILTQELERGGGHLSEVGELDEGAAMVFRYMRAAQEGTARLNLRLMAKIMRGLTTEKPIYADQFLRYANLVASLTIEEGILIGTLYAKTQAVKDSPKWKEGPMKLARDDLIPRVFDSTEYFNAVMAAASRTGLVRTGGFSDQFCTTPLMDEVARLVSFREALAEEGIEI